MTTTQTTPAVSTSDPDALAWHDVFVTLRGWAYGGSLDEPDGAVVADLLDLLDFAVETLPRFVIVQNPTTFGGDDCSTGYTVVDRTLAQPDATIGAVVLRGDFLECRAAAHIANLDPDGWDHAFTEGGF